jgi:hypothetical protein
MRRTNKSSKSAKDRIKHSIRKGDPFGNRTIQLDAGVA